MYKDISCKIYFHPQNLRYFSLHTKRITPPRSVIFCDIYDNSADLFPEPLIEEFFHRVRVPIVNAQGLDHFAILIQHFDYWVWAACVFDFETWKLVDPITFDKGWKKQMYRLKNEYTTQLNIGQSLECFSSRKPYVHKKTADGKYMYILSSYDCVSNCSTGKEKLMWSIKAQIV